MSTDLGSDISTVSPDLPLRVPNLANLTNLANLQTYILGDGYFLDDDVTRPTSSTSPTVRGIFALKNSSPIHAVQFINLLIIL